jgi:hypothetical protein
VAPVLLVWLELLWLLAVEALPELAADDAPDDE